jgi:hypothetical protein
LGRRRLHLVELKYYSGTLRGDDLTWRRDGHRAEDSPLKLVRRKAQRLASKLRDELVRWSQETGTAIPDPRDVVPFVQEAVFLHHPRLRCLLPPTSRIDLFGLDGSESETGLPGISERLLEPATPHQSVGTNRDDIIAALMARIGVVQRRQREAGSWVIDEEPLGAGQRGHPGRDAAVAGERLAYEVELILYGFAARPQRVNGLAAGRAALDRVLLARAGLTRTRGLALALAESTPIPAVTGTAMIRPMTQPRGGRLRARLVPAGWVIGRGRGG